MPTNPRSLDKKCGANESIDVAVENAVDIPDFKIGSMVFDALLGVERIGANLTSESDLPLFAGDLLELFSLFQSFSFK